MLVDGQLQVILSGLHSRNQRELGRRLIEDTDITNITILVTLTVALPLITPTLIISQLPAATMVITTIALL